MNISILIPVSNDLKIIEALKSIDEKVQVVVSLNKPSQEILKLVKNIQKKRFPALKNLDIVFCKIDYKSIAGAYNNGIKTAKYDNILLMDSDCIFEKGTIKKLFLNYKGNLLSKGKVIFKRSSFLSGVIARAREFHTSDKVSAYSPPLLFKKKIINYIDDYYFHPNLCWLEDSEFDKRVRDAKLNISYDPEAIIYHPELTIKNDLKSAFWYGVGKRIGVKIGIHDKPTGIIGSFKKYVINASKVKGLASGIYLFIWKLALLFGYWTQKIFKIRPEKQSTSKLVQSK